MILTLHWLRARTQSQKDGTAEKAECLWARGRETDEGRRWLPPLQSFCSGISLICFIFGGSVIVEKEFFAEVLCENCKKSFPTQNKKKILAARGYLEVTTFCLDFLPALRLRNESS